ncbi:MAG: ferritin family protein [Candidatus Sifarchaeia archaeon]
MSLSKEELKAQCEKSIAFEEEIVAAVNKSTNALKNLLLKELLRGVAFDSMKHALVFRAIIGLLEFSPAISDEDNTVLNRDIKVHIENEEKAIKIYEEILDKVDNEKIKFMLETIIADEHRHHELLKTISKFIIEKETIQEDEWFDYIYKYSLAHGAPIG